MKYLRRVKGVTKMDKIRKETIRTELETESILEHIETKQLRWWGHLQRMGDNIPVKQIWESKVPRKRRRGRPQRTWENTIEQILMKRGTDCREAKKLALNKKEWIKFMFK
ncbi:unnamed protein product [Acanthoscelides obtectus]|uniref:Endonuclease-reverse transcriptase n=1 Tax=Acanthoscelides obtectus TaxID=200917 RepID=A0A9P0L1U8_ACAOB|nr:unnamed protein product [Acanthoscelides obtectus]CAK1635135.1 hypothetical protein AOBTE_LOCUS9085 [Acanthoscelides obtectus]